MNDRTVIVGLALWGGAIPLIAWRGVGGPIIAAIAGAVLFLSGALLVVQWMVTGGMPPSYGSGGI